MEKEILQEGMGNFLRLSGKGEETIGDRMFMYQNIPGFLPMEVTWINGKKHYVYDVSGKLSLEKYFSGHVFGVEDVKYICRQILRLPEELQRFLLDGNGAVLHEEYLYVDPRTKELAAVYYPESSYQGMGAMGHLLEFIMENMNQKDRELVLFVYGMHRLTKEEGTTRHILKMYMEEKEGVSVPVQTEMVEAKVKERHEREYEKTKAPKKGKTTERVKPPEKTKKSKDVRPPKKKKPFPVLSLIFLMAGITVTAGLWLGGFFREAVSDDIDWVKGIGASLFFLGVSGYGAWRAWPRSLDDDTVWTGTERARKVCLIPCQGQEQPIPVRHFPFLIGTDEKKVDGVLAASEISPVHASVWQEGDRILVMDEESAAGTFHNDMRLEPWQKKGVQDGDLLRFAKREYVVEIT